jgi:hypothetical protein
VGADFVKDNLEDKELKNWIIPSFTTTTTTDRISGSILLMGMSLSLLAAFNSFPANSNISASMKNYFSYEYVSTAASHMSSRV